MVSTKIFGMKTLGVILNPAAKINKQHSDDLVEDFKRILGKSAIVKRTFEKSEIPGVMEEFHREQIKFLLISGGDGTICNVLSTYINLFGGAGLPIIVPLMGGTINMIGDDAGLRKDQFQVSKNLNDLIINKRPVPVIKRGLVKVIDTHLAEPGYGFTWIDGLLYRFLLDYYNQGAGVQVASMMAVKLVLNSLSNAEDSEFNDIPSKVYIDDEELPHENHLLVIASSLKKFVFGFDIFKEESEPGKTFNTVYMRSEYLKKEKLKIPFGLYRSLESDASGNFVNKPAHTMVVERNSGYIIDGEIYNHSEEDKITLESGPELHIYSPKGENEIEI
jgi:diacylglycerol kinase family enzyme